MEQNLPTPTYIVEADTYHRQTGEPEFMKVPVSQTYYYNLAEAVAHMNNEVIRLTAAGYVRPRQLATTQEAQQYINQIAEYSYISETLIQGDTQTYYSIWIAPIQVQ
jgi:hypothetical protein